MAETSNFLETLNFVLLMFPFFVLLLFPFVIIWFIVFNRFKASIKNALNYSVLSLITLICLFLYCGITVRIGFYIRGNTGLIIENISTATIWVLVYMLWPLVILTLILFVFYLRKKYGKNKTNTMAWFNWLANNLSKSQKLFQQLSAITKPNEKTPFQ